MKTKETKRNTKKALIGASIGLILAGAAATTTALVLNSKKSNDNTPIPPGPTSPRIDVRQDIKEIFSGDLNHGENNVNTDMPDYTGQGYVIKDKMYSFPTEKEILSYLNRYAMTTEYKNVINNLHITLPVREDKKQDYKAVVTVKGQTEDNNLNREYTGTFDVYFIYDENITHNLADDVQNKDINVGAIVAGTFIPAVTLFGIIAGLNTKMKSDQVNLCWGGVGGIQAWMNLPGNQPVGIDPANPAATAESLQHGDPNYTNALGALVGGFVITIIGVVGGIYAGQQVDVHVTFDKENLDQQAGGKDGGEQDLHEIKPDLNDIGLKFHELYSNEAGYANKLDGTVEQHSNPDGSTTIVDFADTGSFSGYNQEQTIAAFQIAGNPFYNNVDPKQIPANSDYLFDAAVMVQTPLKDLIIDKDTKKTIEDLVIEEDLPTDPVELKDYVITRLEQRMDPKQHVWGTDISITKVADENIIKLSAAEGSIFYEGTMTIETIKQTDRTNIASLPFDCRIPTTDDINNKSVEIFKEANKSLINDGSGIYITSEFIGMRQDGNNSLFVFAFHLNADNSKTFKGQAELEVEFIIRG